MILVSLIFVATVTLSADGNSNEGTECYIKDPPITFGKHATLFCNVASNANMDKCNVIWQNGSEIIVHCGTLMQNTTKYQHVQNKNGSFLIISSFNDTDVNNVYTCTSLRKFQSCSLMLKINDKEFQFIPPAESVKVETAIISTNIVAVSIVFEKVYPRPECKLRINDEEILNCKNNSTQRPNGFFYNSTTHMECDMKPTYCNGAMSVYCAIGNTEMKYAILNVTQKCQDKDSNAIVVYWVISVLLVIICIIITVVLRKKRSRCAGRQYNENDLELQCGTNDDVSTDVSTPLLSEQTNGNHKHDKAIANIRVARIFLPVQRSCDVLEIVKFDCRNNQILVTNTRINQARWNKQRSLYLEANNWQPVIKFVGQYKAADLSTVTVPVSISQEWGSGKRNSRFTVVYDDRDVQIMETNKKINEMRQVRYLVEIEALAYSKNIDKLTRTGLNQ